MKESKRNFLVGLFVLLSLTTLAVLMMWFGETPSWLQRGEYTLNIVGVRQIRGIGDGSPVQLNGVEIGRVQKLDFENPQMPGLGVKIQARIKSRFAVPRGSSAKVYGATLGIGTGQIQIVSPALVDIAVPKDGTGSIPGEMASMIGEIITDEFTSSFKRMVDHIGNLAKEATPLAQNFAQLMERRTIKDVTDPGAAEKGVTPNLSTAIERINELIVNVNEVLGDENVQTDVKGVAADLKSASNEIVHLVELWKAESRRISENVNEGIDHTEGNLREALDRWAAVADTLDEIADNLNRVAASLAEGKGTAGLLVHDPRLYEAAVLSFERLSEFLATLNVIAGRIEEDGYITLGKITPVGTITKDIPVGPNSRLNKPAEETFRPRQSP